MPPIDGVRHVLRRCPVSRKMGISASLWCFRLRTVWCRTPGPHPLPLRAATRREASARWFAGRSSGELRTSPLLPWPSITVSSHLRGGERLEVLELASPLVRRRNRPSLSPYRRAQKMAPNTPCATADNYDRYLAPAAAMGDAPWHEPHWADLVSLPTPASVVEPSHRARRLVSARKLEEELSGYDDLWVSVGAARQLLLECPMCGSIPIPLRRTTLSDLTNAAADHLSEQHLYATPTVSSRTSGAARTPVSASPPDGRSGYFTDHFWSLIALLHDDGAGMEALARELGSSSEPDIVTFQEQLRKATALLDTPAHRHQLVLDLDDPLQTVPAALSDDVFFEVTAAVVAGGRDVWLGVLADPARLAGGWSLQAGRALVEVPASALNRTSAEFDAPSQSRASIVA